MSNKQLELPLGPSQMLSEAAGRMGVPLEQIIDMATVARMWVEVDMRGTKFPVQLMPGHVLGSNMYGPVKSKVMLLLSHPDAADDSVGRFLSGSAGVEFMNACNKIGINPSDWYVTSVTKFNYPANRKDPLSGWLKDCQQILMREIEIVQPEIILAAGRWSMKALFGDSIKLTDARGQTLTWQGATVLPIIGPRSVIVDPTSKPTFERDMQLTKELVESGAIGSSGATNYELIDTLEKLWDFTQRMQSKKTFAIDCEWGGTSHIDGGLRTVQICYEVGKVGVIHLRKAGMIPVLDDNSVADALKIMLCRDDVQLIGHNMRSDLIWLKSIGVNLVRQGMAGLDTIIAHHALYPTDEQQLEIVCNKLLGPDRYDFELRQWANIPANAELIERHAYAFVPDEILIPYAARDADKTMQLAMVLIRKLRAPGDECLFNIVKNVAMKAMEGILEMEWDGMLVDMERFTMFEMAYREKHTQLLNEIREELQWPDFNPASWQQRNDLLFGSQYNGRNPVEGVRPQIRPQHVNCFNLVPIKTTGKPAKMWDEVITAGQQDKVIPSSDNEVMGMFAAEHPLLAKLRDERYLSKAISNFMADPKKARTGETYYASGIRAWLHPDGRVRTHINQLAETGRWRSSNPNMQNLPSQREDDFQRIFGDKNWPAFKTCFVGDPDMPIIIEADYRSAEVMALAQLAGDDVALAILSDPNRDIHSETAVEAYRLPYDPACGIPVKDWMGGVVSPVAGRVNKVITYPELNGGEVWVGNKKIDIWKGYTPIVAEGVEVAEKTYLTDNHKAKRVAGKTVVFGVPYGRGARAIARQVEKFGVECSADRAQQIIDAYLNKFKRIATFLQWCREQVYNPGYLESVYGRRRWAFNVQDKAAMKAQEREFMNWKVQNLVADALTAAVPIFCEYRRQHNINFRLKLAIHDAMMVACRGEDAPEMVEKVLPYCMSKGNVVPKLNFSFGIDMSAYLRWYEKPTQELLESHGWPKGYKIPKF